jgi:hypothetical protein
MKADRDTFGPRLRLERERRGIALKNITASTKIKESLFVELERNDFSNWPEGIFRRAHLCAYASAIGLPPQAVFTEYSRLFPEDCAVDRPDDVAIHEVAGVSPAGQTLKSTRVRSQLVDRAWVVSFDLAAVCLMASILASILGMNLWPALALVGLGYSAMGSAYFAQSIGTYVQHRTNAILQARNRPQAPLKAPHREIEPILSKRTRSSSSQCDANRERDVEDWRASA